MAAAVETSSERRQLKNLNYRPTISLLLPVGAQLAFAREIVKSVRRQSYPFWELCLVSDNPEHRVARWMKKVAASEKRIKPVRETVRGVEAAALNSALDAASGDFVALLRPGDTLAPGALFAVARLLNEHADADMIYTDEDVWTSDVEPPEPMLKPDWSPEYLLSRIYTGQLSVYRRSLVLEVGGFREGFDGAHDYDLALRVTAGTKNIHHIQRVLYHNGARAEAAEIEARRTAAVKRALSDHLERNRIEASCEDGLNAGLYRVRHRISGQPLVSVIIPSAGLKRLVRGEELDLLANCVRSVVAKTEYRNYEIVCVDNGDLRAETKELLNQWGDGRVRNVTFTGPFNIAEKMNLGAAHAAGEHFLFLNDDIEVLSQEWMSAMLEFSQQQAVGAVGAKLYFPGGAIQHAGVRIYPGGDPGHIYYNYPEDRQRLVPDVNTIRNYSAVTGACMMTRREVFAEVCGFSSEFPVNYNDIDYCLKVRARGYRVVYTPYAELFHFESTSRVAEKTHGVRDDETRLFEETWGRVMARDPYHNPLLDATCFKYMPGAGGGDDA